MADRSAILFFAFAVVLMNFGHQPTVIRRMRYLKYASLAAVVLSVLVTPARAQSKPDFSGDWKMNVAKSNFAGAPSPSSMTRKISHVEPKITILEEQSGGLGGDQKLDRAFTLDGKDITVAVNGADLRTSAAWQGNAIVVTTNVDVASVIYTDRMTLSEDRRELHSNVTIAAPQGQIEVTIVFDRQ
jgi:hypothetical protein